MPQTLLNHPPWVSWDPDINSEELLWVGAGSTFIIRRYSFIKGEMFFGYSNLLLVHHLLKHPGIFFFFSVTMIEKISLQQRCWY